VVRGRAPVVFLRQHAVKRLAGDLGDRVPYRDLEGADGDRALGMTAGLLALHHGGEHLFGVEVVAGAVHQRFGARLEDARDEARAHLRAARVAAGRIERIAHDRFSITVRISDDGNDRSRHLAEVEHRVTQARFQRNSGLANVRDAHEMRES
jgi:hypothetical protein